MYGSLDDATLGRVRRRDGEDLPVGDNARTGGWHADPTGRIQYRYWDGASWTDQTSWNGEVTTDPLFAPPPPTSAAVAADPPITSRATPPGGRGQRADRIDHLERILDALDDVVARLEALEQTVSNRAALDLVTELAKARERRSHADPLRS
jgi:hypothetical protein